MSDSDIGPKQLLSRIRRLEATVEELRCAVAAQRELIDQLLERIPESDNDDSVWE